MDSSQLPATTYQLKRKTSFLLKLAAGSWSLATGSWELAAGS
jgi:hypothetical protein